MENLLVAGGAGFMGANFVRYLLKQRNNYYITIVDSLTYSGNLSNLTGIDKSRYSFVHGNILDNKLMDNLVKKTDIVINFAAETHNDNSIYSSSQFIQTNIVGTYNLIEACRIHNKRYHHISTDEVFGDIPLDSEKFFSEISPYNPSSPYSSSKASSDLLVKAWIKTYGLKATISNSTNNYGCFQHVEKFIPRQITNLIRNSKPVLYGNGCNIRDWIHVDDHSSAILKIIEDGTIGESYLIGGNNELSNFQVLQNLLYIFDKPVDFFENVPDRLGHDMRYSVDTSKLRKILNWHPIRNDFQYELKKIVDWYIDNEKWWLSSKLASENKYKSRNL